jgi:hypothetical protein
VKRVRSKDKIPNTAHLCALLTSLFTLIVCILLAGCSPEREAVLFLDSYWPLSLKAEEQLQSVVSAAQRGTGFRITPLRSEGEDAFAQLGGYIEDKQPEAVLLGAFAAMELRLLAENYPEVRFCVFDAPKTGIPRQSPFLWVAFDAGPVMEELGEKIRGFLEASPGAAVAAFLDPAMDEVFSFHPALSGLPMRRIRLAENDTAEIVRGKAGEALSLKPALYILCAGVHTSLIFDFIRQQGNPARIVLDGRDGMPSASGFPVLASLERSYPRAIRAALLASPAEAGRGTVLRVPAEIR